MLRLFLCSLMICLLSSLSANAQNSLLKQLADLPAPAPVAAKSNVKKERPADFFSHKNIPPDDAPLEDLLDYWSKPLNINSVQIVFQPKPSAKTVERILDFLDDNPTEINKYLQSLPPSPEVTDRIKSIYNKITQDAVARSSYPTSQLREWLKFNNKEYSSELVNNVRNIKDANDYVANENQQALLSLARIDWDTARSYVERMESDSSQPYSQILANWALYQHAIDADDSSDAEKYRERLKKIVEDKSAAWAKRDLAMDALVAGGNWDGRDEWYFSLLEDETLLTIQDNGNTGLTTMVSSMPPETYRERLLKLLQSDNKAVRTAAARNLIDIFTDEKEILEGLLPWLSDPNWAKESNRSERNTLIENLGKISVPESVPALITILTNEEDKRSAAATALAIYKDLRAVPALKSVLSENLGARERKIYIDALGACGGFSDDEQMTALEVYAAMISTPEGAEEYNKFQYENYEDEYQEEEEDAPPPKPVVKAQEKIIPLPVSIRNYVAEQTEPGEGLMIRAIERVKILRRTNLVVAARLTEIMKKWQGRAVFLESLNSLRSGEADIDLIISLLAQRKIVREKIPNEINNLRGAGGIMRGIGACLAEDENEFLSILGQPDAEAQTAMLGCARMLRVKLPIDEVEGYLKSPNKLLALTAERFIESEDSVRARTIILAKYPNEARILGARNAFNPDEKSVSQSASLSSLFQSVNGLPYWTQDFANLNKINEKLRGEIKQNADMLAVYALSPNAENGQKVIRVYKNRITYTFYEDAARFWERNLTPKEYEAFFNFIISENIDVLTPVTDYCESGCASFEFTMFGRGGGRRVFYSLNNPPKSLITLSEFFESFRIGEIKLHYRLADKIKGLEVLSADEHFPVHTVWKSGADLRFVVENPAQQTENRKNLESMIADESLIENENEEQRGARFQSYQKRRTEIETAHFSWRTMENGKLGGIVAQPSDAQFLYDRTQVSSDSEFGSDPRAWKVRSAGGEIRTKDEYESDGLYRVAPGQKPYQIRAGKFFNPLVSPDGKWAVASKLPVKWGEPRTIVRVNLQNRTEFKVNIPPSDTFLPIAFLPTHNKFLLFRAKGQNTMTARGNEIPEDEESAVTAKLKPNPSPKTPEYYLLDANTGNAQLIKGEFRPLIAQTFRPLQPTGNPNEFWAAIYDEKTKITDIGRYNDKSFTFQTVTKLPEISLDSMNIWVDEKENKIYFTYQGHLLSVPLN